ncbi:MAG: hypothetical protein M3Y60_07615 [Bacteroidota bacterium]|nr:hypothetical protein [Bacteroidota bacterium]
MKILAILGLCITLFFSSCKEQVSAEKQCVRGRIVGQKCDVFALQLDEAILGAREWNKWDPSGNPTETFSHVVGLINLQQEFRVEGRTVFVFLRKPINDESDIPCFLDIPNPPMPYYIVIKASDRNCDVYQSASLSKK